MARNYTKEEITTVRDLVLNQGKSESWVAKHLNMPNSTVYGFAYGKKGKLETILETIKAASLVELKEQVPQVVKKTETKVVENNNFTVSEMRKLRAITYLVKELF